MDLIYDALRPFAEFVPNVFAAVAILVVGLFLSFFVAKITKAALSKTTIDNKIANWLSSGSEKPVEIESIISNIVFWGMMIFVIWAFLAKLKLEVITQPLEEMMTQVFAYLPQIVGALILFGVAWFIASGLRIVTSRVLSRLSVDDKLTKQVDGDKKIPLTKSLSEAVYWLVFLLFLPMILSTLELDGLMTPVNEMMQKVIGFLPNIFESFIILVVGWFIAKMVRRIVSSLLDGIGLDNFAENTGLDTILGRQKLSGLAGLVVYILILIPVILLSLDALKLEKLTRPASEMIGKIMNTLPDIFAAILVMSIAIMVGKVVSGLLVNFLRGIGFNNILMKLGLGKEITDEKHAPSVVAGQALFMVILLFAAAEASDLLGFATLSSMIAQFMEFAGHVVLGLIIFAIGLYLGNLASKAVIASNTANAGFLSIIARLAIVFLSGAMALRQMGLANEIITIAFGCVLGAVAVAAAIAFGIGGREIAGKELEKWVKNLKTGKK